MGGSGAISTLTLCLAPAKWMHGSCARVHVQTTKGRFIASLWLYLRGVTGSPCNQVSQASTGRENRLEGVARLKMGWSGGRRLELVHSQSAGLWVWDNLVRGKRQAGRDDEEEEDDVVG